MCDEFIVILLYIDFSYINTTILRHFEYNCLPFCSYKHINMHLLPRFCIKPLHRPAR